MAVPSFPEFHVTGAVHHYVRVDGLQIFYLGTAEVTPKIAHKVFRKDAMNDIAGKSLPGQKTHDGEMAVIGVLLNRYSKETYDTIRSAGFSTGIMIDSGYESRFARGALSFGRESFELWQVFEFATDPAFRSTGLELGYYWPQVLLAGHDRDTLGTEVEKLMLVMEAYPFRTPYASTSNVGTGGRWLLYQREDANFPADVLVPQ